MGEKDFEETLAKLSDDDLIHNCKCSKVKNINGHIVTNVDFDRELKRRLSYYEKVKHLFPEQLDNLLIAH